MANERKTYSSAKPRAGKPFETEIAAVMAVAKKHGDEAKVLWYGSFAIVGCTSLELAWTIRARLKRIAEWSYDLKPGRKHRNQHYLKITFDGSQ
jgi:hypothetical protein